MRAMRRMDTGKPSTLSLVNFSQNSVRSSPKGRTTQCSGLAIKSGGVVRPRSRAADC
jgi:hypothetical protein